MSQRCDRMVDVGRRKFMSGAGLAAAGAAVTSMVPVQAKAAPPAAASNIPRNRLANMADLKVNEPKAVSYPDDNAPGVLLKLGKKCRAASAPTATWSAFQPRARTRAFRSVTTPATRP